MTTKHRTLWIQGDELTYCGHIIEDEDDVVRTWTKTTCSPCHSARLQPCKRGHSISRRKYNAQGNLICIDCVNISTRKHHKKILHQKKMERLLEEHLNA